jgi:uncharacterized protein YdhG (YjbR/CyaY superfamily)
MTTFKTIEEYMAAVPDERRPALEELRRTVNAAAPEATETIAYQMPALRSHGGQFLVSYAAYKAHYSLFPASGAVIAALGKALEPRFVKPRFLHGCLVKKRIRLLHQVRCCCP